MIDLKSHGLRVKQLDWEADLPVRTWTADRYQIKREGSHWWLTYYGEDLGTYTDAAYLKEVAQDHYETIAITALEALK